MSLNEKNAVKMSDKNALKNLRHVRFLDAQNLIVHRFRRAKCYFMEMCDHLECSISVWRDLENLKSLL